MGGFGGFNEKKNKKKKQNQAKFSAGGLPMGGGLPKPVFTPPTVIKRDRPEK